MTDYEATFERLRAALERDSRTCAAYAYTELAFHNIAGLDGELRERVNEHAAFWNTVLGGLQTAAFIVLGKIYDDDRQSDGALHLIRFAEDYRGIFSRKELEARKVKVGLSATDAHAYASEAFEPRAGAFKPLRDAFDEHRALYVAKAKPIRHQVFAHAGRIAREERDALFSDLFVRELERLVVFPLRLASAFFRLYHDGIEPVLADNVPTVITDVLAAAPGEHTSTWEHLHAAANVTRFLKTQ